MSTQANVVLWPTADGQTHEFTVYTLETKWNATGGLYIFAYNDGQYWKAVYIGKTEDFSQRVPNHPQWPAAERLGATHIHARVVAQETSRANLEQRLIAHLRPPLNRQLR